MSNARAMASVGFVVLFLVAAAVGCSDDPAPADGHLSGLSFRPLYA